MDGEGKSKVKRKKGKIEREKALVADFYIDLQEREHTGLENTTYMVTKRRKAKERRMGKAREADFCHRSNGREKNKKVNERGEQGKGEEKADFHSKLDKRRERRGERKVGYISERRESEAKGETGKGEAIAD